jgi:hypothetical protein
VTGSTKRHHGQRQRQWWTGAKSHARQGHRPPVCATVGPTTWFGPAQQPGNPGEQQHVPALGQDGTEGALTVTHQGSGKPWLTLQSLAALELKAPFRGLPGEEDA